MPLHPPDRAKENILVVGGWGSGKSRGWVDWAKMARITKAPGRFYVVDSDKGAYRNLQGSDGWEENVDVFEVYEWKEYKAITKELREKASSDDVLVWEMLDNGWDEAQAVYSERVRGKSVDEWVLEYHERGGLGHHESSAHGTNWGAINKIYTGLITEVKRFPGHVYATAKAKALGPDDSNDLRAIWGPTGIKPNGQKFLAHDFSTVLWLAEKTTEDWVYTTIKDRERPKQVNRKLGDFVSDYLIDVAGWGI